jgi:hypothetical protein
MTSDALERLRAANPVSVLPAAGAAPVFEEAADPRGWWWQQPVRRRSVFVLGVGVVVLGGAAAIAAARSGLWLNSGPGFTVQTSSAQKLVEFTLPSGISVWSGGTTIAMWRLPQDNGWVCYRVALASPPPTSDKDLGEGICGAGDPPAPRPMGISFGHGAGENWLISGQVNPASGIRELELDSPNGRLPLSYANGWFLAELPPGASPEGFPDGGPYLLVGRNEHGNTVAQVDIGEYYHRYHGSG